MAAPVILTASHIYVDPSSTVLKAKDHAAYLDAQDAVSQVSDQLKAGYEAEKERGYQDGMDLCRMEQAEHMLKVVSRTINYLASVEKSMADLLLTGVRKIITDFDQEELAVGLIKNALQHVRNEKQVTIRIPTSQYSMMKARVSDILEDYKGVGFIDLVADQGLSTGDCIMESEIGIVEASVDIQLQALQKRFETVNASIADGLENSGSR